MQTVKHAHRHTEPHTHSQPASLPQRPAHLIAAGEHAEHLGVVHNQLNRVSNSSEAERSVAHDGKEAEGEADLRVCERE